jgi:polysaccharide pyruvyl transferase WcaK-like protein
MASTSTNLEGTGVAMERIRPRKRIGVFGHVGQGNLGDEAIIAAVLQALRQRYPEAELVGFTMNPEDTQARHQIRAFPIRRLPRMPAPAGSPHAVPADPQPWRSHGTLSDRLKAHLKAIAPLYALLKGIQRGGHLLWGALAELRFLRHSYKHLQGVDLLIIAGSQPLIDYVGGPWAFPYTILKWVLIAKVVRAKVAFVSVGAGPIHSRLGRLFIREALARAHYRSYRDESSKNLIERLRVPGSHVVAPDLVYSLQSRDLPGPGMAPNARPIVGLNAVPFYDPGYWPGSSAHIYACYVNALAEFALWLIQRGYAVLFFPTQLRLDPPVIHDIRLRMKAHEASDVEANILDWPIHSLDDLMTAIARTEMIVATRFHGIVLPYLLYKPVVGIAYHQKTHDLLGQLGQSEYVLDLHDVTLDALQERFLALESKRAVIREEIERKISFFQQRLAAQYDQVCALLEEGMGASPNSRA